MEQIFFHIDVNSAYLSWSAVRRLKNGDTTDLREIPSIIGGDTSNRHGIVLAKSIPAKAFGIYTSEPVVSALRKCPNLVMESPDHQYYSEQSHLLMEHLRSFCPQIEQVSVDECYMDFTPIMHDYASPVEGATIIKDSVRERFGFTVNIGVSDRKILAKMASDFKKPDLVHTLFHDEIRQKMWPLPVSSLFMCGKSSVDTLRKLEILTIGDLAKADPAILSLHLKSHGLMLYDYANGRDASVVNTVPEEIKGIGNSTTLAKDATQIEELLPVLMRLSESVAGRLRDAGKHCSMISVEIKYNDFTSVSHQAITAEPTDVTDEIYDLSCSLIRQLWNGKPVRLLGVRSSKLSDASEPVQLSLFDTKAASRDKLRKLDAALDHIKAKYGEKSVVRGSRYSGKRKQSEDDL